MERFPSLLRKKNKLFYIILRFTFQTQVGFVPNLISLILAIAGH